ncbi:hypothetical protein FA13DRAFT_1796685 [Coprinellus micaceus]|uniref:Uncharacterized protein n=1 Tax=Coprinellus micaceus TaxID=71717 RepID=A0A4Y7SUE7_COPMI|nr:hypothetical protein FA13DRAFT_1796685 [Coprinellus micaceus]
MEIILRMLTILSILGPQSQNRDSFTILVCGKWTIPPHILPLYHLLQRMHDPYPALEVMEEGPSNFRLAKMFKSMRKHLVRIVMRFVKAYPPKFALLDENYGFVDTKFNEHLQKNLNIEDSVNIKTWPAFFHRVQWGNMAKMGKGNFCELLRGAIWQDMWEARASHESCGESPGSYFQTQRIPELLSGHCSSNPTLWKKR